MNFDTLSALEHMAMADRENVQTGLLAWILGAHSPLHVERRIAILGHLTGILLPAVRSTSSKTEDGNIDLVVTCHLADGATTCIAIENKLKAAESAHQLQKYDEHLKGRNVHAKVFLSLLGEPPRGGIGWLVASYSKLYDALESTGPKDAGDEDPYVRDARAMLQRLVTAVSLVTSEPRFARYAFSRGPRERPADESAFAYYVKTLRLERLLQRAWCIQLARRLGPLGLGWATSTSTGARSASALLDIARVVGTEGQNLRIGLQLQGLTLKAFCHPHPYPRKVSEQQRKLVAAQLEVVRAALSLGAKHKISHSRDRGFRSFALSKHPADFTNIDAWTVEVRKHFVQLEQNNW